MPILMLFTVECGSKNHALFAGYNTLY